MCERVRVDLFPPHGSIRQSNPVVLAHQNQGEEIPFQGSRDRDRKKERYQPLKVECLQNEQFDLYRY